MRYERLFLRDGGERRIEINLGDRRSVIICVQWRQGIQIIALISDEAKHETFCYVQHDANIGTTKGFSKGTHGYLWGSVLYGDSRFSMGFMVLEWDSRFSMGLMVLYVDSRFSIGFMVI